MPSLAFTADSRQTEAGRLYNRSEEDETRIPLQKAIDDADYEHGHRVNELDFLTAFRSPVMVARKSNCAFNTVRLSSTGRPWIVAGRGCRRLLERVAGCPCRHLHVASRPRLWCDSDD